MKIHIAFILVFLLYYIHSVKSLKCYTCSCTEDDADTSCLDNLGAKEGDITDCDKKYCILVRIDYKDPRGKLQSISRNCVDKPAYIHEVIEDETHIGYFTACKSDLCNDGNGHINSSSGETGVFGDK
ncbi:unnamed protein product [Psylliodes chrysocephalus]|uniref:Protein quiver n=1 Tax=Psylliodes chrysocephalus TaxID=3402493 RepID=A0A9P0D1K9_9CUCU|nr:unnamed protein product [Psylliodes chrysocephala]